MFCYNKYSPGSKGVKISPSWYTRGEILWHCWMTHCKLTIHPREKRRKIVTNTLVQGTPSQSPAYCKNCGSCGKQNHFKVMCKSMWWKQQDWCGGNTIHNIGQHDDLHVDEQDKQDRIFGAVMVRYINLYSVKTKIFAKLESGTSQRQTCIVYKVNTETNGISMPFNNSIFVSKIDNRAIVCHKNYIVEVKMYNNSNIEQLDICTVKLNHKDNVNKCRFFVVPGDGQVLLGTLDIEMLCILKITCEVTDGQQASRKFDS